MSAEQHMLADVDAANVHRRMRVMVAGALAVSVFQGMGQQRAARVSSAGRGSGPPASAQRGTQGRAKPPDLASLRRRSRVVLDLGSRLARMDRSVEEVKLEATTGLMAGVLQPEFKMVRWTLEFVDRDMEIACVRAGRGGGGR